MKGNEKTRQKKSRKKSRNEKTERSKELQSQNGTHTQTYQPQPENNESYIIDMSPRNQQNDLTAELQSHFVSFYSCFQQLFKGSDRVPFNPQILFANLLKTLGSCVFGSVATTKCIAQIGIIEDSQVPDIIRNVLIGATAVNATGTLFSASNWYHADSKSEKLFTKTRTAFNIVCTALSFAGCLYSFETRDDIEHAKRNGHIVMSMMLSMFSAKIVNNLVELLMGLNRLNTLKKENNITDEHIKKERQKLEKKYFEQLDKRVWEILLDLAQPLLLIGLVISPSNGLALATLCYAAIKMYINGKGFANEGKKGLYKLGMTLFGSSETVNADGNVRATNTPSSNIEPRNKRGNRVVSAQSSPTLRKGHRPQE